MSLFYQKAVGLDKKAIYLGHGQPDSLYDLYHGIGTRLFRRVLRDGGGAFLAGLPVSGGAGLEEDIAGLPIRLGYRVAGHILLSVLSLVVCPAQRGLPALFRLAVYLLLPDRPFPHEAGRAGGFPPLHYLVPGLLALAMLVWSCFVPFDVRLEIVRGKAEVIPAGYEWYTRFFTLKPLLRVVFGLLYYILTLALLVSYYKRARGKDTLVRGPACWVIFLVGVSIASLLSSVLPTFMPRSRFYHSIWTAAVSCGIALQHVLLSYHVIRREYCLYVLRRESPPSSSGETDAGDVRLRRSHSGKLTQRRFERFFREHKPFLRPGYKMTDLVEDLDVNRTVLSAFINQTYGMNFNRYLNRFRLRELDRLRLRPANQGKSVSSLIGQVGFKDFRTYSRAVATEREAAAGERETKEEGGTA